ncbi:hypothetical protein V500_08849 [Pseudogymnoascus sp. VKM F-4518 (FW-2643)]|nr:hypothetical protein V500_08849 [Pseudogymnoascus sp. VKM F-4518 (FW-2643)]
MIGGHLALGTAYSPLDPTIPKTRQSHHTYKLPPAPPSRAAKSFSPRPSRGTERGDQNAARRTVAVPSTTSPALLDPWVCARDAMGRPAGGWVSTISWGGRTPTSPPAWLGRHPLPGVRGTSYGASYESTLRRPESGEGGARPSAARPWAHHTPSAPAKEWGSKSTSHHTAGAGATGRAEGGGLGMSHARPLTLGGGDWLGVRGGNVAGGRPVRIVSRPYTTLCELPSPNHVPRANPLADSPVVGIRSAWSSVSRSYPGGGGEVASRGRG